MSIIENKQNKIKRGVKVFLWSLTAISFLFFIYKVVIFSTSVSYYDFELDEEVKPTVAMILSYSIGAFIGAFILPIVLWIIFGLYNFFKSERYDIMISKRKSRLRDSSKELSKQKTDSNSVSFIDRLTGVFKNINPKTKKLIGLIWGLFHLFMLLTSNEIFYYRISWDDFWFFNGWEHYQFKGNLNHYDISEFIVYVIIPVLFIYGRKYIKGDKILSPELITSTSKSSTDDKINDLKKYKELFDLGVISEEEFIELKKKLL